MKLILLLCSFFYFVNFADAQKPKIAFSFDDGSVNDMPGYKLEEWNEMLLKTLEKNHIKSVLFVKGGNMSGDKGEYVISSWDNAGHKIANHTYSHKNFNNDKVTLEYYENDFLINDTIVRKYKNFYPYFRFPFLKEGNTKEKIDGFRQFLTAQGYSNGHVTIDNSDWYISSRLVDRLKENAQADISGYRQYYVEHLFDHAQFYDSLSTALTGRKISHVILLHHNLAAALFLNDAIEYFKTNGWEIMDTDEAFKDEIYKNEPANIPAGESLIWALAKQSGKFENVLRYPAEEGEYEKEKMDKLGL